MGGYLTNNSNGTGSANTGTGAFSFGNEKSMDTWTFILGEEEKLETNVTTKVSDLKVNSIVPDVTFISPNDNVTYTVEVQNSDGSANYADVLGAPYSFNVPNGMEIVSVTPVSSCGGIDNLGEISTDKQHYNSKVDLPNGCKITYTIVVEAVSVPSGPIVVETTIMRPPDVTDPDATNPDPNSTPTDPHLECKNGTSTESCNNIKYSSAVTAIHPKISLVKSVTNTGTGDAGKFKEGEIIQYQFIAKNVGDVPLTSISLTESLPDVTLSSKTGDVGNDNVLSVNEEWTYTGQYTVKKSDGDPGKVINQATVTGIDPGGKNVSDLSGTSGDNDSPTETPVVQDGKVSLVKSVTSTTPAGGYKLDDVIAYQFVAKNEGNVTLDNVTMSDNIAGVVPVYQSGDANNNSKLDVGESWTYTASYTITQADVDAGKVSNTAVVNAKDPAGNTVTDNSGTTSTSDDPTVTPITQDGKVSLVKSVTSATPAGGYKLGDVIAYRFVAKNEGNVTLDNVALTDNISGVVPAYQSGDANNNSKLDVGESWTYTASYTITQTDVDAGKVSNTAVVNAKDPAGNTVTDNSGTTSTSDDPTETSITQDGKVSLVKSVTSATPAGGYKLGDVIAYRFVAKNEGNVTLDNVALTDNISGVVPAYQSGDANNNSKLDVGESWTYTASYTITQADVDAGKVSNTAVVNAKDPAGNTVTDNSGTTSTSDGPTVTPITQDGKVSLVKSVTSATPAGGYKLGDVIAYRFVAKNEGNVTLDNVTMTDNLAGVTPVYASGDANSNSKLDVGESWTYTASYTITQTDVDAGKVSNTAVVNAKDPAGNTVTDNSGTTSTSDDPTETSITQDGKVSLVKSVTSATPAGGYKLGDVIAYQFVAKNEGNVTLDNVALTDNISGVVPAYQSGDANNNSKLDVGESWTYTASYTITQADVDAGKVSNTAVVNAKDPAGNTVTDNSGTTSTNDDPTETVIPQTGKVSLVKTVTSTTPAGGYKLDDVIAYQFVAKNEGNVTLDNVTMSDNIAGVVPVYQSGDANSNSKLDVGESWTYTASYTITQTDVDAGKVSNTAVVNAKDPAGNTVTDNSGTTSTNDDPTVTPIVQNGKVSLVKSVTSTTPAGGYKLDDVIAYQFVAKNEGNVTLDNVTMTDNLVGVTPVYASGDANSNSKLDVGESWTYTASYTITQTDVDAGKVSNTAVVNAKDPAGNTVTDNSGTTSTSDDPTETSITQDGKVSLVKSVTSTTPAGGYKLDDVIAYRFVAKNEGNVTLDNVTMTDNLAGVTPVYASGDANSNSKLDVGESWTYTASYTITQADVDAGKVSNTAVVNAKDPAGNTVTDNSGTTSTSDGPTVTPITQDGKVSLVKSVTSATPAGGYKLGDVIAYRFVAKNEGNVTLDNVTMTDNLAGVTPVYASGDANSNSKLDVGESWTYTASYTITQTDVDAGKVSNTAVVNAKDPAGNTVTDNSGTTSTSDDPTETSITQDGKVSLVKSVTSATPAGGYKLGDVIAYQFVAKNEGNVTLDNVALTDNISGVVPAYQSGDANNNSKLDVGESWTYTASYTITQADVDAGKVSNTAVVNAKDPAGNTVTDNSGTTSTNDDPTVTPIVQNGKVSLVKTVTSTTPAGGYKLDDVIAYQFVAKNEGNVTLDNVIMTDNLVGVTPVYASGDANSNSKLDVGESWTYTASYTITQTDVDAGKVSNTAVVNAKDPAGNTVTDNSGTTSTSDGPTVTPITQDGKVSLVKSVTSATPAGGYKLGDVIAYRFVAKNEGNVTLDNVTMTDNLAGVTPVYASGDANSNSKLDVGESWTYTASYTITQTDVDAGKVSNTAVVNAKDPAGNTVTDNSGTTSTSDDPTETSITQDGKVSLVKSVTSATPAGGYKLGDVIAYRFVAKNEGNVTLDNVALTDNISGVVPAYQSGDANNNSKLDVGESWTYTASYTITQTDVDAGKVSNTAVVNAKDPAGNTVTDNSGTTSTGDDPTETVIPQTGKVSLVKTVTSTTPAGGYKLDDVIAYQFVAKNEGNVTLDNVTMSDNLAGVTPVYASGDANSNSKLDVGESWTYTASYTITQTDVDAGKVSNTAVVNAKDPAGNTVTDNSGTTSTSDDPTVTPITQDGKVSLVKSVTSATPAGGYKLGDVIAYRFVAKNEGNVTLDNVTMTDNLAGVTPVYASGDANSNSKLDVGESWTYTASYTITQADVDAGKVSNTAVVNAKDPAGNTVTDNSGTTSTSDGPTVTPITQDGKVSLVKSVTSTTPAGGYKLDDVIAYQFVAKNEGNVTLDNVTMTDNLVGVTPVYASGDANSNSKLDVGESWTYTASYTITQADVDAGKVSNTAVVNAKDPAGNTVTDNSGTISTNDDPTVTPIAQNGKVSLVKSVISTTPAGGYKLDDVIAYQFVAKNEGNVTLDNVTMSDNIAGVVPAYQSGDANNNSKLDVGESWTYTASYTITQTDVDAGKVSNTAVVNAKDPAGNTVTDNSGTTSTGDDPTETVIPQTGKVSLVKTVTSTTPAGGYKLDDVIAYQFVAKNEGNVTLDNVTMSDNLAGVTPVYASGDANSNSKLDVGESWTYTASYTITQTDVDAGKVSNTAVVNAKDPAGNTVTDNSGTTSTSDGPTVTPITQDGKVSLVKSVTSATPAGGYKLGDVIAYRFVAKNEGNVTLDNVTMTDNLAGVTPVYASGDANSNSKLDVGESWTYTASYTITQADVDAGKVSNTAVVNAKDPAGNTVTDNSGTTSTSDGPTVTPITQDGKVSLVKSVTSTTPAGGYKLGDVIAYQFVAKNEGNVTLDNVALTDNISGVVPAYQSGDANNNSKLDVGESWTYTASYTITQTDVDAGKVSNTAVVNAKDPAGNTVTDNSGTAVDNDDPTVTPITQNGKVSLVKSVTSATPAGGYKLGDVIAYRFVAKNEGNVTLDNITMTDNLAGVTPVYASGDANGNSKLDVGESWTYTASYTITQTDVDAGKVSNTAVVNAKDPAGNTVTDNSGTTSTSDDPTETSITQDGKVSLVKTVTSTTPAGGYKLGDVIAYRFVAKNEGNVTLDNVTMTDNLAGVTPVYASGDANSNSKLDVGESWTYTASYTITQADVDAGKVSNTAVVNAKDPAGNTVTDNSGTTSTSDGPTVTPITQDGKVSLVKSVTSTTPAGGYKLDDVIAYQFVAKNEGNVTLDNVTMTDNLVGITPVYASGDANSNSKLDVGESWTYTASYTITQADVDAGKVSNTAVVNAKDPAGNTVTDNSGTISTNDDPTVTPIAQNGKVSLVKSVTSATPAGGYKLDDVIAYQFVAKNEGNVTLDNVTMTDNLAGVTPVYASGDANSNSKLDVGESWTYTASYTITQTDVDAGKVSNTAVVNAKDPAGNTVTDNSGTAVDNDDPTVTPIAQNGKVSLIKTVTNVGMGTNGAFILGNQIEYTFTVTNTGNVGLKNLVLTDPLLTNSVINIPGVLEPGKSITQVQKYTITNTDIALGRVINSAVIKANDHVGNEVKDISGTATDNDNTTVTIVAKPPIANDDAKDTMQNKPVTIDVQKNDQVGSSPIVSGSTVITKQPKNGTVAVNADGTVTYTPNNGYTGTDEFEYTVTDVNGQVSNPAKVTITIVPSNPVASDDAAETQWNKEVKIPILDNDRPSGAPLDMTTIDITEQPKHGAVRVNSDGTVTYLPNSGYTGNDSFKYRIKDVNGNWTNVATVTVKVTGFFIPNVITPNGDGKNDAFVIVGLENYHNVHLTIFNRWGNEVYRSDNYKNTWTGDGLNEGTYYYLIRLRDGEKEQVHKGWVLLKR
ncbi:DUF11 domain-containing protein [Pedobacter sp. HDW13]|uniref:DUF7507 domain-containing protein n=1 Tax=Pedobacter sp. HDW13 TaxID=2714940 RepID=UPI001407E369|nr:Ig-like domain-containing protein [Pedobacter sp. HDW13]QIL41204.1 DUF11 domain-containing protein [Pedobacter sp. HDW13]